jgi:hypothetical protein
MYKQSDEQVHNILDSTDFSHLEKLLLDLERLSRFGGAPVRIENKKKMIQDHIRFLMARALRELADNHT